MTWQPGSDPRSNAAYLAEQLHRLKAEVDWRAQPAAVAAWWLDVGKALEAERPRGASLSGVVAAGIRATAKAWGSTRNAPEVVLASYLPVLTAAAARDPAMAGTASRLGDRLGLPAVPARKD